MLLLICNMNTIHIYTTNLFEWRYPFLTYTIFFSKSHPPHLFRFELSPGPALSDASWELPEAADLGAGPVGRWD